MTNWDDIVALFSGSQFDLICDGTNLPCHKYETDRISVMNIPEGDSGPSVTTVSARTQIWSVLLSTTHEASGQGTQPSE